ncbi:MAG TPA: hypothetical protein PLK90_02720 [Clostridiales bacterium]|nr:hypothetical protein [Clostridiales bacterium]HQP69291.1 hypothetical protein [Clostridiales bacterium]
MIEKIGNIKCTGIDNIERDFILSKENDNYKNIITFYVSLLPIIDIQPNFYMVVEKVFKPNNAYKVTMINCNNDEKFCKKGIPDSLLPRVADYLQTEIISSSGIKEFKSTVGETRYPEATTMWERLRQKGIATYSKREDIYTIDYKLLN